MTEDNAKELIVAMVSSRQFAQLERFVAVLLAEARTQSLIANSTFENVWGRHIVDSAQLQPLAPSSGEWLDVGSGGGLPGVVIGILRDQPVILCEPRRKRAAFLTDVVNHLGLEHVEIVCSRVQALDLRPAVISARAVAPMLDLFSWTAKLASRETFFLFPRGQSWATELATTKESWQGAFHVEHSRTDRDARIIVASGVHPR